MRTSQCAAQPAAVHPVILRECLLPGGGVNFDVFGMGAVAEVMAESGKACAFKRLGVPDTFSIIGLHEDLMAYYGFDMNGIVNSARELMNMDFEEDDDWDDEL